MITTYRFGENDVQYSLKLFNVRVCTVCIKKGMFWIRVPKKGILIKDKTKHSLTFAERNRLAPYFNSKKWLVSFLK